MRGRLGWTMALAASLALPAGAAPTVLWVSDPVRAGDTVLVFGDGLAGARHATVTVHRAGGGTGRAVEATVAQSRERSTKIVLPAGLADGIYDIRMTTAAGGVTARANVPTVLWAQGDRGRAGSPGGFVRLVGRNLAFAGRAATVLLQGASGAQRLPARRAEPFTLEAALPANLPAGAYHVRVDAGAGAGESVPFTVAARSAEPARRVVVPASPSAAEDGADRTEAVQHALDQVGAAGGGVVYLPRGRYSIRRTLTVPAGVTLQGAGAALTALCWPDSDTPPEALIQGPHGFTVRDLTVYGMTYRHGIVAEQSGPNAGRVRVLNVRMRIDPYRGHITPEETDRRFRESLKLSTGGGDSLRLGGKDVEVAGCDIYGGGRSFYLLNCQGGWVHDNTFYNGRWGWYCITGSDGLIFERNTIQGADLMSTGGGVNNLGSIVSRNVYYADNHLRNMFGWDREAMTTDAGGGAYYGYVASAAGNRLTLAADPKWERRDWKGCAVFILDGKGQGQFRQIAAWDGRDVTLDRPFTVPPDRTSVATITMLHENYLFVGNTFDDAGVAIQMYGTSIGNIAYRNVSTRTGGFHNFGMNYHGVQPSWFVQWLDNRIAEGNVYGGGHDQSMAMGEAHLGVLALPPHVEPQAPVTLCGIIRGNRLENNAHLAAGGSDPPNPRDSYPYTQDVVVEHNRVTDASVGLVVARASAGVYERDNTFTRCAAGLVDDQRDEQLAHEAMARYAGKAEPVLKLTFDRKEGDLFRDETGHGFDARCEGNCVAAPDGVKGGCLRLDGTSYLRVERSRILRPTSLTVSAWVKADDPRGRWGVVSKRERSAEAPFVLGIMNDGAFFEATDTRDQWSFNLAGGHGITAGTWHHLAAVLESGVGVTLYLDGREVARRAVAAKVVETPDTLCIGLEAWGGFPPSGTSGPVRLRGEIDEVAVWARPLSAAEIGALARRD